MSLSENELLYLMAYVDGQVDDDELPEVEQLLARSEEAREIVRQHGAMGDWVRDTADGRAAEAGADRVALRVMKEIDALGGAKVITLEKERARRELNRQRVKEFSALAAVAAVAAAFFLMPANRAAPTASSVEPAPPASAPAPRAVPQPAPPTSVAAASSAEAEPAATDVQAVDVQAVESPAHPFSIFYVPGSATGGAPQSQSVVVWIDE